MPNEIEIDAAKTAAGGWTRDQLAEWDVPWPPPKGWRRKLIEDSRKFGNQKGGRMPGTTYTREGPKGDPLGRLADFARFAEGELEELSDQVEALDEHMATPATVGAMRAMWATSRVLARQLDGFTTADDS